MHTPSPKHTWSLRKSIAFSLGLTLLPVFWVWWTSHPRFSRTQRAVAITWTALYVGMATATYPLVADRYHQLWDARLWIFNMVTAGLSLLLIWRMFGIQMLMILTVANVTPIFLPSLDHQLPRLQAATVLAFAFVCALHLSLDLLREGYRKLEKIHVQIPLPW